VSGLSVAILRYLLKRPQAQDTVEGIAAWWLSQWRVEVVTSAVRRAVRELCARELLVEIADRHAAEPRYRLNRAATERIQSLLIEMEASGAPDSEDCGARR
jgi:hypothetical protein